MTPLHPAPATPAVPPTDPVAAHMRGHRHQDLLLILINPVLVIDLAATARARIRRGNRDLLIDMIGNRPVPVTAVALTAAPPTSARVRLRVALGKRRRLTLARPPRLVKLTAQQGVLHTKALHLRPQPHNASITTIASNPQPTTLRAHHAAHRPTLHRLHDSLHTAGILPPPPTSRPAQTAANSLRSGIVRGTV